jgi:hypothetical protein
LVEQDKVAMGVWAFTGGLEQSTEVAAVSALELLLDCYSLEDYLLARHFQDLVMERIIRILQELDTHQPFVESPLAESVIPKAFAKEKGHLLLRTP